MKKLQIISILLLAAFAISCKSGNPKDTNTTANTPLVFEQRVFNMESATCKTDSVRCASIATTYPFAAAGDSAVTSLINDTIKTHLLASIAPFAESPANIPSTLEEAGAQFIGEYEYLMSEETDYIMGWSIETEGELLFQSDQYVSVALNNYSFTGGAHPNYYTTYLSFDAKTGAKIDPVMMVADVKQLMTLAEAKFKEARELSADANLVEEGFFWDGAFVLAENIAITKEGLQFAYNPYEAAAYAMGPTEFTISYAELGDNWKGKK